MGRGGPADHQADRFLSKYRETAQVDVITLNRCLQWFDPAACRMPIDLRAKSSYELVVVTPVEAEPCLLNLLHMDIEVALEGPLAQRQHVHEVADLKNELSAQKGQSSSEAPARRRRKPSPYYSGATAIERVLSCCNPRSPSAGRSSAACSLARTARRPQRSWTRRRCRGVRALL